MEDRLNIMIGEAFIKIITEAKASVTPKMQ